VLCIVYKKMACLLLLAGLCVGCGRSDALTPTADLPTLAINEQVEVVVEDGDYCPVRTQAGETGDRSTTGNGIGPNP